MWKLLTTQSSGYAVSFAAVGLITLFYYRGITVNTTTVVLTFLLGILVASTVWGLKVSVFMSVVAVLFLDYYFLPPVGGFEINRTQDWVTLIAFVITAVIGSDLSARATRQAQIATEQRNEVSRLYKFSQHLLTARSPLELLDEIPARIVEVFQVRSAGLYLSGKGASHRSGIEIPEFDAPHLKAVQDSGEFETGSERELYFCPVRLGSQTIGICGVSGPLISRQTLEAIASLIASAVDRVQAIDLLGKTEAARENERLKSVLLDAIAHDFKTPLTSIKAAATSLLEDLNFNKSQRGELLIVIDEESDRINHVIGQAIEMAQLDAGAAKLAPASHDVGDLIDLALEDCDSVLEARPIRTKVAAPEANVYCDLFWARKVLGHLIQNADLYSSPGEPITISTEEKDGHIVFHVVDSGPGIEPAEIGQIFEKFYRGKGQRHRVPGTGMGLAVAKAIVNAHGGNIEAASEVGKGSDFIFSLPTGPAKMQAGGRARGETLGPIENSAGAAESV